LISLFEEHRDHLRGVAYRMLGSLDEADDALQQVWLRASRADLDHVSNLVGWLTTVTGRECLDMLRARRGRKESPLHLASDVPPTANAPEEETLLADSVGLALLVVLDRLSPSQRVAFVLHDLFAVPFDEIAVILERSTTATKKLASRARQSIHGAKPIDPVNQARRTQLVRAFLAASRNGDIATLLELLAPEVIRTADTIAVRGATSSTVHGSHAVADETRTFTARAEAAEVALIDGAPGIIVAPRGRLFAVLDIDFNDHDQIITINVTADPHQLDTIALALA
jgi:RNA polymerase sigma factor (sigma-70 family)